MVYEKIKTDLRGNNLDVNRFIKFAEDVFEFDLRVFKAFSPKSDAPKISVTPPMLIRLMNLEELAGRCLAFKQSDSGSDSSTVATVTPLVSKKEKI